VYNDMFTDATEERTERMFHYLDPDNTGYVDYLGWSQSIKLQVSSLAQLLDPVCTQLHIRTCSPCSLCFPRHLHIVCHVMPQRSPPACVQYCCVSCLHSAAINIWLTVHSCMQHLSHICLGTPVKPSPIIMTHPKVFTAQIIINRSR